MALTAVTSLALVSPVTNPHGVIAGSAHYFSPDQFGALFTSISPRVDAAGNIFKNAAVRTSARSSDTAVTCSGKQATTSSS